MSEVEAHTVETNGGSCSGSGGENGSGGTGGSALPTHGLNDGNAGHGRTDTDRPATNALFQHLSDSFAYVRQRRELGRDVVTVPPPCVLPSFLREVTVNFIDPTTSSITTASGAAVNKQIQLYEKFVSIFENEYKRTLNYVPYQLFRNDSGGVIDSLPVRTIVARSHGGGMVLMDDMAQSAVHDYAWEQPYCHVYLAACESTEHYRTKVKPSIQAFVSQLEAATKSSYKQRQGTMRRRADTPPAAAATAAVTSPPTTGDSVSNATLAATSGGGNNGSVGGGSTKAAGTVGGEPPQSPKPAAKSSRRSGPAPRYVIIYVPTGDRTHPSLDDVTPKKPKTLVPTTVASRFTAVRQRMTSGSSAAATAATTSSRADDSVHSSTTLDTASDTGDNENASQQDGDSSANIIMPASIQKLNKAEREIVRRFANDFPSGNVCTLSTLADGGANLASDLDDMDESSSHFQKLEWNAVMKAMGAAITAGFSDRCQRFDDELRKLDLQRRGESFLARSDSDASTSNPTENFYLSNFFLVKESLAFTYEQMRLPAEALLQYQELRAFLPDRDSTLETSSDNDDSHAASDGMAEEDSSSTLTTDILEFRSLLRSSGDFAPVASVVDEYIFAREVSLLFQMHKSIRVVQRCLSYAKTTFEFKKSKIDVLANTDLSTQQLVAANKWAVNFCWDVKRASDDYYQEVLNRSVLQPAFVRGLCDLLDFARLRLEQLGVMLLPGNSVTSSVRGFVQTVQRAWSPWVEPTSPAETVLELGKMSDDFIGGALVDKDAFVARYLDLTESIATFNEFCGRRRYAARLRMERMEIFMSRGEKLKAAREIALVIDVYDKDQWSACHFALLFRLADVQRLIATPKEYLETLIRCFSESTLSLAPTKALDALYTDLTSVVRSTSLDGSTFDAALFFSPAFGLEGIVAPRSVGTDRNLLKRLYTVGDDVNVTLSLNSHLPKDIEVSSICVNLVPFPKYVAAMEDNLIVQAEDVCRVLTLETTTVGTGENTLSFKWLPKNKGQFIISSVVMTWNKVKFSYTAKELRRPTIRIDVVPCNHTQQLVVRPNFIIPGHVQPLRFEFNSGTDVVSSGKLHLEGSPGFTFLPPDTKDEPSAWVPSFDCSLATCEPSGTVSLEALVNVTLPEDGRLSMQSMRARLSTTYRYPGEEAGNVATEFLDADLGVTLSMLEHTALSALTCDVVPYANDKAMVNVVLTCNTPTPVTIKRWMLELPTNFTLAVDGDLNDAVLNTIVSAGDPVSLCFDCLLNAENIAAGFKAVLRVDIENEMGTLFQEPVQLDARLVIGSRLKTQDVKAVNVQIAPSATEAGVGAPVSLLYSIDCTGLTQISGMVLYSVDVDDASWIVSGKPGGQVTLSNTASQEVQLIAIPIRSGRIDSYPALRLTCKSDAGLTQIPVNLTSSSTFAATPPTTQTTIAYPVGNP